MELKYVLAQFFYATALAQSGHIPEALKHMRIIAASDADRIEDTVNEVYYTPGYRLVERANKALVALSKEEETAAQNQGAPGKK